MKMEAYKRYLEQHNHETRFSIESLLSPVNSGQNESKVSTILSRNLNPGHSLDSAPKMTSDAILPNSLLGEPFGSPMGHFPGFPPPFLPLGSYQEPILSQMLISLSQRHQQNMLAAAAAAATAVAVSNESKTNNIFETLSDTPKPNLRIATPDEPDTTNDQGKKSGRKSIFTSVIICYDLVESNGPSTTRLAFSVPKAQ